MDTKAEDRGLRVQDSFVFLSITTNAVSMTDTRERILEEATEQLIEGGYPTLNFGVIAGSLGVTRQTLHHHFGDKQGLATAAIARYRDAHMSVLRELADRHAGNFPAFFHAVIRDLWDVLDEHEYQGFCACAEVGTQPDLAPEDLRSDADAHFTEILNLYAELIEASQRDGPLRSDRTPDRLAHEALALQVGIGQMARMLKAGRRPDAVARELAEQWLSRIEATSG